MIASDYMKFTILNILSQEVGRRENDVICVITATRTTATSYKCRHSPAVKSVDDHGENTTYTSGKLLLQVSQGIPRDGRGVARHSDTPEYVQRRAASADTPQIITQNTRLLAF